MAGATLGLATSGTARVALAVTRPPPLGFTMVATDRRMVALTFDDGPDPHFTPAVLDLLAARQVTATFFVVGVGVAAYPDLVRRMVAEGHEVANHTWGHERLDRLDRVGVRQQLQGGADAIDALGLGPLARPRLVRPPFGFEGAASRAELEAGGWEVARWRGCLEKFLSDYPSGMAATRLADAARPGDVLLAHDGGGPDRRDSVEALPELLARLASRGLTVRSIGGLQGR